MNCRKCNIELNLNEFTENQIKRKRWICKPCHNAYRREDCKKKKLEGRPYKQRAMGQEYHLAYRRKWAASNRDKVNKYAKEARERDRVKYLARDTLNKAVTQGRVIKHPCVKCGNEKSEGHHEDYNKPLEVVWFCRKHHAEYHKINKLNNE
jgi:hypothetical protein